MVINTNDNINDINLKDTYYDLELKNDFSSDTNCIIVMISRARVIQGPRHTISESFTNIGETAIGKSSFGNKMGGIYYKLVGQDDSS